MEEISTPKPNLAIREMQSLRLLEAIQHLLRIERTIDRGTGWVLGETWGMDSRRYLVLLSHDDDLGKKIEAELKTNYSRITRALAKASGANVSGGVLDGRVDKTFVIKTSPGAIVWTDEPAFDGWQALHLNDLVAEQVLNLKLNQVRVQSQNMLYPMTEVVNVDPKLWVLPDLQESGDWNNNVPAMEAVTAWAQCKDSTPFLTIFGIGGLGKTTLLKLAGAALWQGFCTYQHSRLPVYVPMKGIPSGAHLTLASHINSFELFSRRTTAAEVESLIQAGIMTVFLDAFDEHLKFANRSDAIAFLNGLKNTYGKDGDQREARLVLTSRDYYLTTDMLFDQCLGDRVTRYTLRPFNAAQRQRFINLRVGSKIGVDRAQEWSQALEAVVENQGESADYLIGHSLFLLAFCEYVRSLHKEDGAGSPVHGPEDFASIQSSRLFDEVIDRINNREASEKSHWRPELYQSLVEKWHVSPFDPKSQRRFFAAIAKHIFQDKAYFDKPAVTKVIKGVEINELVEPALTDTFGIPQAIPELDPKVQADIETEALDTIAHFFRQHPLVDGQQSGFSQGAHFAFRHATYHDYFLKEYLALKFEEMARQIADDTLSKEELSKAVDELVTELFLYEVMQRATNALFFLCWDNRGIENLVTALERLFWSPVPMESEVFGYLLTYALVFVRLYRDLRMSKGPEFIGLCFDNGFDDQLITLDGQDLNRYLTELHLSLCTFGNLHLRNAAFRGCDFMRVTVRKLALSGTVRFERGTLFLVTDTDGDDTDALVDAIYPLSAKVTIELDRVKVHRPTLEALRRLQQRWSNIELVEDHVEIIDFETEFSLEVDSPARRVVDQLMRLVRKDRKGEFGVYRNKFFGRTLVSAANQGAVEKFLKEKSIITVKEPIFVIADEKHMYQPDELYGRTFAQVSEYWNPILEELDQLLAQ